MKIDKNDPRLTAYVLGELSPADKALIEAALKTDSELQAEVLFIRKSTELLQQISHSETHRLSANQREAIFPRAKAKWAWWSLGGGFATAALAVMLLQRGHIESTAMPPEKPSADIAALEVQAPVQMKAVEAPAAAVAAAPAPAKEEVAADSFARSKDSDLAAYGSSGSSGSAYVASTASKRKMFAASKAGSSGGAPSANMDLGSASASAALAAPAEADVAVAVESIVLTRVLPQEIDSAVSAIVDAAVQPGLNRCFAEQLSKYVKYHLVFSLKWKLQNGAAAEIQIVDLAKSNLLTAGLQNCLKSSVQQQKWPAVSDQFEFRLTFDSK